MAANIEQIFQDFILSKIREIEDQNEDKSYVNVLFCIRFACSLTELSTVNKLKKMG